MIKTKALIALFAVLLKVQANVVTVTANTVAVVTATALATAVATDPKNTNRYPVREERREDRPDNYCHAPAKVHHHRKHHKACGHVEHPKRKHHKACAHAEHPKHKACAHHKSGEHAEHHKHKACAHAEHHKHKSSEHAEHHKHKACAHHKSGEHAEHHKHKACEHAEHHKHKACEHAEHPKAAAACGVPAHPKAAHHHKHKACGVVEHPKAAHHQAIDKMRKGRPLAAHLKHVQGVLPGKERKDHDSNDFASFEVAQLDILRVTKLDSEHKHDDSVKIIDKDVKESMSKRADKRQGARQARRATHSEDMGAEHMSRAHKMMHSHKMAGDDDMMSSENRKDRRQGHRQDRRQGHRQDRRRLHHRVSNNNNEMMSDSDNDVRAHARLHHASNNGPMDIEYPRAHTHAATNGHHMRHPRAHAYESNNGSMDMDHPRARAHHVANNAGPDAGPIDMDRARARAHVHAASNAGPDVDHPRAHARAHAHVATSDNKPEGFFDRLMAPSKAQSNNGPDDKKDIKISANDRKHLIADLKAIDALDREALQYLDTSCGNVKGIDKKKTKHAARKASRHMKKH